MLLAKSKPSISKPTAFAGLLSGSINYQVQTATATTVWVGPKIDRAMWLQILAFFKHVFESTRSECQVRLYVNLTTKKWAAHAFPQEAKTGMTAKEIENPAATDQRKAFADTDGWQYLGTVHHHCAASAFQSGVDHANEKNQDGLHITVGKVDEARHDIHARFYLDGCEFAPDMSAFWDVGDEVRRLVPPTTWDIVARYQMCEPAPKDAEFPAIWKENLIEIKPVVFNHGAASGNGTGENYPDDEYAAYFAHTGEPRQAPITPTNAPHAVVHAGFPKGITAATVEKVPLIKRREIALKAALAELILAKETDPEIYATLQMLADDKIVKTLKHVAARYCLSIFDITAEWEWQMQQEIVESHRQLDTGKYSRK